MRTRILFISNGHVEDANPALFDDVRNVTYSVKTTEELTVNLMDSTDIVILGFVMDTDSNVGNWLADFVDQGGKVLLSYLNFQIRHSPRGRFESENYSPFSIAHGYSLADWGTNIPDGSHEVLRGLHELHSNRWIDVSKGKGMTEVLSRTKDGDKPAIAIRTDKLGLIVGINGSISGFKNKRWLITLVNNITRYQARFGLNAMFDRFNDVYDNQRYLDLLNIFEPLEVLFDIEYSNLIKRKLQYEKPIADEERKLRKDKKRFRNDQEELEEYIAMLRSGADLIKKLDEAGLLNENGELDEDAIKMLQNLLSDANSDLAEQLKNNKFVKDLPEPLKKLLQSKQEILDKQEALVGMKTDSYDELRIIRRRLNEMSDQMEQIRSKMTGLRRDWEKSFMEWGSPEVGGWVRSMHHEFKEQNVWKSFTRNDIEGEDLKGLDEEALFGFGVEKFRHRSIILTNIINLPSAEQLREEHQHQKQKKQ